MFINKEKIRKIIFLLFCSVVLTVTVSLTYYITFFEEAEMISNQEKLKKIEICNEDVDTSNTLENPTNFFFFKLITAFFAGGLLSDRLFIKLGVF
jgi:hypothetical protein